jgi:hypothetical protein
MTGSFPSLIFLTSSSASKVEVWLVPMKKQKIINTSQFYTNENGLKWYAFRLKKNLCTELKIYPRLIQQSINKLSR